MSSLFIHRHRQVNENEMCNIMRYDATTQVYSVYETYYVKEVWCYSVLAHSAKYFINMFHCEWYWVACAHTFEREWILVNRFIDVKIKEARKKKINIGKKQAPYYVRECVCVSELSLKCDNNRIDSVADHNISWVYDKMPFLRTRDILIVLRIFSLLSHFVADWEIENERKSRSGLYIYMIFIAVELDINCWGYFSSDSPFCNQWCGSNCHCHLNHSPHRNIHTTHHTHKS